ncbi:rhodanese-like domain-containing protein [Bordetella genomosp. 9]|nr:rhodanese-like domain-containing protein [Bordetella genomosp. 9]
MPLSPPEQEPPRAPSVSAAELKAMLSDGHELAVVDVSEEGQFGMGHMLLAVNIPYSLLELQAPTLVPRKTCRVVVVDHGGGIAARAARRLRTMGYTDVSVLDGGIAAWEQAGHQIFQGTYVASKAFGEWVEHHFHTPSIGPEELAALLDRQADIRVLDPRTVNEHAANHVPRAVSCPSAELIYRFDDLVPSPDTMVVVACGGRTRGIIGAQSLINAGVPNRVVALADGNHGWKLAGLPLEAGLLQGYESPTPENRRRADERAARIRREHHITQLDHSTVRQWLADPDRTTLLLDVRTAEEYHAGHYEGARHAPGGQLLQATDRWLGTLGARIVVIDTDGTRSAVVCHWLRCMNWDAYTLVYEAGAGQASEPDTAAQALANAGAKSADEAARVTVEPVERPDGHAIGAGTDAARIDPREAYAAMRQGAIAISFDRSADYLQAHPAGALWASRAALDTVAELLRQGRALVLFSRDGRAAELAAMDLRELASDPDRQVKVVRGGTQAWQDAGHAIASKDEEALPQEARIDTLYWMHDRRRGNKEAMQRYLNWEKGLLAQLERDGYTFTMPASTR